MMGCLQVCSLLLLGLLSVIGSSLGMSADSPFSPGAALRRHWNRLFPSEQMPGILLNKASPLNATQIAVFSRYIDDHTLSAHISSFCSAANLFCDLKAPANVTHDVSVDADFTSYSNKQFRRYQTGAISPDDRFTNYSVGENVARDMFVRYAKDGTGGLERFTTYALDTNVAGSDFTNYDSNGNGMSGFFDSYGAQSNVQGHNFATYGAGSSADGETFTSYTESSNVVRNEFKNYDAKANGMVNRFTGYATSSNVGTSDFRGYGDGGNGGLDTFENYGDKENIARNNFASYQKDGNGELDNFNSYGEQASQSDNEFRSYGKGTNELVTSFTSYGNSTVSSKNNFVEYNKDAAGLPSVQFSTYVGNETSFKEYAGAPPTFGSYFNVTPVAAAAAVEPGKFFRQANLVAGKRIPMPDIRDKMPARSFLPRALADKLPFSSARLPELMGLLGGASGLHGQMSKTVADCERPAVKDETKRCVTSLEGMSEFAVSVQGNTTAVSTTASTAGWGKSLVVGRVAGRHGGGETRAVSCHQSLFPYLVYYCHAVPRVAVYDVGLKEEEGGEVVNNGVAICHLDTSQWSAGHAAFVALGPAPGEIEVCHWIFENDLIWVARG